jgi:hypothetical protein
VAEVEKHPIGASILGTEAASSARKARLAQAKKPFGLKTCREAHFSG